MKLLDRLERRFGRFAVPHVTVSLIFCQVLIYLVQLTQPELAPSIELVPRRVLEGDLWRLVSFLFEPPMTHPLFAFFFWYLFYLMGTALEHTWGTFRYDLYLLIGYLATVAASFLQLDAPASVGFLQGSVFLAFAWLYPDFQLLLFFLLPVKIKWLALLTWIGYFLAIVFSPWPVRLTVGASVCNFLLFFGRDVVGRIGGGHRRMVTQAGRIRQQAAPRHVCCICGIDNKTHPTMRFRYCTKCGGSRCYCWDHLYDHEHVVEEPPSSADR
ncbi:MAG: hypothetical protein JXB62_15800 [Pirellulales bacterium]|nr:hypothetical protein [Pirellulales bacterium]